MNYADSSLEKAGLFVSIMKAGFKKLAEKREADMRKGQLIFRKGAGNRALFK